MVARYDSVAEFARVAERNQSHEHSSDSWYGNVTGTTAVKYAISGDDSYVAEAEKLMDKLESSIEINAHRWEASMYGAYPIVPEFLAGSPTPMRCRVAVVEESTPISIYVSTSSSAGVDSNTMLKRGTAVLALLLKMQAIRPVELYLLSELHGTDGETILVIKVESKPLNVGVAAFTMCNVGFARHLCYDHSKVIGGFNGSWPKLYRNSNWEEHLREVVGMNEIDLYIPAATTWDKMVTDPINWVNAQVKRFVGELEN